MWKYLVFNGVYFLGIFLVNLFGNKFSRALVFIGIFALSIFTLFKMTIDPFIWATYVVFSLVIFWSASQFKRWTMEKSRTLSGELNLLAHELELEHDRLAREAESTDSLNRKANQIADLYDETKEMSQSLDVLKTFFVFSESLAHHLSFETVKLAVFSEGLAHPDHPSAVYELHHADLSGFLDESFTLTEEKAKSRVSNFDKKILELIFRHKKAVVAIDKTVKTVDENLQLWPDFKPFVACPIVFEKNISFIVILYGVQKKDSQVISILAERFISEIERVKLYEKIETLAITDGMTGVAVRRHLLERLEGEFERAKNHGFKLSFLMIDIDFFKHFNDHYGHLVGDIVLKQVAETIKKNIRELDLVGRYGGEEFGVLLVETDDSAAFFVAERIRRAIAEREFRAYNETLNVTVSIGCATYKQQYTSAGQIIECADAALYEAKKQGRNRVSFFAEQEK